ncbi:hypothetical protein [Sphingobium sp. EM0848]|uniref:hypothetical protein n=1 Tax=Sphingobium sp. EM0848 TaxID=2743473 RepID=UPI00159C4FA7|nr:hypothetical protein [Sphingobium sp. EM0848]
MEKLEARLVQYQVLADHRLHFGKLYFLVIATNLVTLTGATVAIVIARPAWWIAMRLIAGIVLVGTAFVAHRLHHQEGSYAAALRSIEEEEESMLTLSSSGGFGARQIMVVALITVGVLISCEAGRHLI